jgi:hypothetical protein
MGRLTRERIIAIVTTLWRRASSSDADLSDYHPDVD